MSESESDLCVSSNVPDNFSLVTGDAKGLIEDTEAADIFRAVWEGVAELTADRGGNLSSMRKA